MQWVSSYYAPKGKFVSEFSARWIAKPEEREDFTILGRVVLFSYSFARNPGIASTGELPERLKML